VSHINLFLGQHLFIIVRGSVKVKIRKEEYGLEPIFIDTVYDGDHFGDLTWFEKSENLTEEMVRDLNARRSTCISCEYSEILKIDKRDTNKIFNSESQKDFEQRIRFLKSVELFKVTFLL
jgi:hypothetical protein